MPGHLNSDTKTIRVANAAAAGTSDVNSTVVDMAGWGAVKFTALLGALTATQVTKLKAQQGDAADGSDMADVGGAVTDAAADADGNKLLVLDVSRGLLTKRYVRAVLDRGTANAVLDGIIAELYLPRSIPVTADATVSRAKNAAP